MSGLHAFLPPSAASLWVKCALSAAMIAAYPQDDSVESLEGTAAHWVFEELFAGRSPLVGAIASNGVFVTEEMLDGAELYVHTIDNALVECGQSNRDALVIERRVAIPYVHQLNWGTPDTWAFLHRHSTGRATLYVWDYKFGHDFVDEFENWQCIDYVCGILDELQVDGAADQLIDVVITVVQPRCYVAGPVRTWRVKASDLRPYFNTLQTAAQAATQPNPTATVNAKCKHCPGRHACVTLQRAGYEAATLSSRSVPVELPPQALGLELTMLSTALAALKARVSGLEESVFAAVLRGERIPGWGTESTFGRRDWTKPVEEVIALGEMLQLPLEKKAVVTPTQAKKLGLDASLVEAYSAAPSGALKLVAHTSTLARKVFSQ